MIRYLATTLTTLVAGAAVAAAPPLVPREGYVATRDGTQIYYEIAGSGARTVVVSGGYMLREGLDPLTERARVLFYDARGRGRSDAADGARISLQHQVDDLSDLLEALGLERVVLLGYSGMGKELFAFAAQHPQRVERLLQVAPVPPYSGEFMEQIMNTRYARADAQALAELREKRNAGFWKNDPAAYCRAEAAVTNVMTFADAANAGAYPDVCVWPNEWPTTLVHYLNALLPSIEAYDAREDLHKAPSPRLVIYGVEDAIPAAARRAWVKGTDACLVEIPGAAHWPFVEAPAEFFAAAYAFVSGEPVTACASNAD